MGGEGDDHAVRTDVEAATAQAGRGAPGPPGADQATAATHYVNGRALKGPYPPGIEFAIFGMGCFWGRSANSGRRERRLRDRGRLRRRRDAEPDLRGDLHRPHRPRGGRARRLRPGQDLLRGSPQDLLGEPRPDPGHAAGQRRRHAVPLGDLCDDARAARRSAPLDRNAYGKALAAKGYGPISTEIAEAGQFYFAEDYHQQYLAKNPGGYCGLGGAGVSCA